MNKHLYRIVFNVARGQLMAVAEIAGAQGKGHSLAGGAGAARPRGMRVHLAKLRALSFATQLALGATMLEMPLAHAQIIADPSAPGRQRPTVMNTANGVPNVNIQTPSAAGVSRNSYIQFDVQRQGAILNNARTSTQTQLGGWIQGNPWLATGSARVILNEVNSSNPSWLRGYVEVGGDRAQVIIANPAGITCDGCGYINTSRATLTTGTPIVNEGNLESYLVQRGVVTVQGAGMDASSTDFNEIIARAVQVNAGIWAKDLKVTAGANRVSADHSQTTPMTGSGRAPAFAIDVAQLGGMYAGKIRLVATEAGVGVRNAGQIGASAGELIVTAQGRLENSGTIYAIGDASLSTRGNIDNSGLIAAQGNTTLVAADSLTNRGLIDGQETIIEAAALNNLGTGRIYGDHVAIGVGTLINSPENAVAPVIAGRMRVDIAAQTITNREHALIFSAGDMAIGGALDANRQASGQAGTLNNNSASIEALGSLDVSVGQLNNTNEHFSASVVELSHQALQEYQSPGSPNRYQPNQVSIYNDEVDHLVTPEGSYDNWTRYDYTRSITETQVQSSDPGQLISRGAMRVNAGNVLNDKSRIIAGGTLTGNIGTLRNSEPPGERTITDSGSATNFYRIQQKGRDDQGKNVVAYNPPSTIQAISLRVSAYEGNGSPPGPGTQIAAFLPSTVTVPSSSLYRTNLDPAARYLVETDPRLTDYRSWLSSDFMLQQLKFDPAQTEKRLGDGFYEQKLVREQVAQLTGKRFLDGYADDEAQYQALLDNGVTVSRQWNLRPGIALSAEQVAQLTSDIVWLVEKDVTLANGQVTKVLAPQLYVRVKESDLDGSGALIAGNTVNLNLSGDLTNAGTIAGRSVVALTAENVKNLGGRISGEDTVVRARVDLDNLGGRIDAARSLTATAGRDLNVVSSTRESQNSQGSRTNVSRVAGLYVSGAGGSLTAAAGRDVNLTAAQVVNTGEGGSTTIAAGNNLNLGTLSEASRQSIVWNSKNYRYDASRTEVGTAIQASGDIRLAAGNDLNARAASVRSEHGGATATAERNINFTAGESTRTVDEAHQVKGSNGAFSSKTITTRDTLSETQALGSTISANTVDLQSGADLRLSGSNVVGTQDVGLVALRNIAIEAAQDVTNTSHFKKEQTSGLYSSGGASISLGAQSQSRENTDTRTTAAASTVGSAEGNVAIQAGNAYRQVASDVVAPRGNIDITARSVDILEAQNTSILTQKTEFRQSGLTLALSSPVLTAIETGQQMSQASSQTKDSRLQALAAATTALAAKKAYDAVARDPSNAGGITLSLSVGLSEARSTTAQTSSNAAGSTLTAGRDVSVAAKGAGADSDITVRGSSIKAGNNISLQAESDVNLLAARNTSELRSASSSISASLGVGLAAGKETGVTVEAGVAGSHGKASGDDLTWTNTRVDAGNTLKLDSGADTTLKGAVASGEQVIANVGGNLNIESLQDTSRYTSKDTSAGVSVSLCIPPICYGSSSGVNLAQGNLRSGFASVTEQSGIKSGDDGFQVTVKGNTALKGAVIASSDKAAAEGKNSLTTGTLTQSDIQNKAEYTAQSVSVGIGYGGDDFSGSAMAMNASDRERSTTRSGISGAQISITDESRQQALTGAGAAAAVASINRNVSSDKDTSNALKPIFNEEQIRAEFAITGAFAREAGTFLVTRAKEADAKKDQADKAEQQAKDLNSPLSNEQRQALRDQAIRLRAEAQTTIDDWGPGGTYRQITTALVAAASGNGSAASSEFARNMVVNYVQQQGAAYIGKLVPGTLAEGSAAHAALHAILACAGAAASSQSCASGAAGAAASSLLTRLFSDTSPDETNSEREAKRNLIASIVTGIASTQNSGASTATNAAIAAVDNNYLTQRDLRDKAKLLDLCPAGDRACRSQVNSEFEQRSVARNYAKEQPCIHGSDAACRELNTSVGRDLLVLAKESEALQQRYDAASDLATKADLKSQIDEIGLQIKQGYAVLKSNLEELKQRGAITNEEDGLRSAINAASIGNELGPAMIGAGASRLVKQLNQRYPRIANGGGTETPTSEHAIGNVGPEAVPDGIPGLLATHETGSTGQTLLGTSGSTDIKVIGRRPDTAVAENWPGHDALDMPNWTMAKNMQWVDAGIANKQTFYLGSPIAGNMTQTSGPYAGQPTIMAMEIRRVENAGYVKIGDYYVHPSKASNFRAP